jgi:putative oxidoreductase
MTYSKKTSVVLWIVQGFLALFFVLGSGAPKLFLSVDMLPLPVPLPEAFVKFIGVGEVLGGIGLILPGVLHTRPWLTTLAAMGLVVVTISATVYQLLARQPESAVFAAVMCLLAAFVAFGRWRLAPLAGATTLKLVAEREAHVAA